MQENDKAVLVYSTFPTLELAETVGSALVDAALAASVNILPGLVSIYNWKGVIERATEVAMIVKTRLALAEKVTAEIARRHPYETPAIIVVPVLGGAPAYLAWISEQTSGPAQS